MAILFILPNIKQIVYRALCRCEYVVNMAADYDPVEAILAVRRIIMAHAIILMWTSHNDQW